MHTLFQLTFTFFIAITMVSCGGDSKTSESSTASQMTKGNSDKPVPTFKMDEDKSTVKTNRTVTKAPTNNNNNKTIGKQVQNSGRSMNNKIGAAPVKAPAEVKLTDGQILAGVPNACSLISVEEIAEIFGISASIIKQKDASHTKSPFTRSCFFRWDGASANTGILIQVQANPVEEEYAEWVSLFVSSKRTTGEKTMGTNETFKYEKLEGLGDDGSYSHRLGKYIWRDGNKYAFMIAFNTNSAEKVQMKNAKRIGNIMMKNYKKL